MVKRTMFQGDSNSNSKKPRYDSPTSILRKHMLQRQNSDSVRKKTVKYSEDNLEGNSKLPLTVLKEAVIFVEVNRNGENCSGPIKILARKMGAKIRETFTRDVTHVIFKNGMFATFERAKLLKIHLVSVLWLDAIKKHKRLVPEREYPAIGLDILHSNVSFVCSQIQVEYGDPNQANTIENTLQSNESSEPSTIVSSYHTAVRESNLSHINDEDLETASILANNFSDMKSVQYTENQSPEVTSDDSNSVIVNGESINVFSNSLISNDNDIPENSPIYNLCKLINSDIQSTFVSETNNIVSVSVTNGKNNDITTDRSMELQHNDPQNELKYDEHQIQDNLVSLLDSSLTLNENAKLVKGNNEEISLDLVVLPISERTSHSSPLNESSFANNTQTLQNQNNLENDDLQQNNENSASNNNQFTQEKSIVTRSTTRVSKALDRKNVTKKKSVTKRKLYDPNDSSCCQNLSISKQVDDNITQNKSDSKENTYSTEDESETEELRTINDGSTSQSIDSSVKHILRTKKLALNKRNIHDRSITVNNEKVLKRSNQKQKLETENGLAMVRSTNTILARRSSSDFENLSQINPKKRRTSFDIRQPSIVCTKFHTKESVKFSSFVQKLGHFQVKSEVESDTTHLVVGEAKRTVNLLRAMIRGCWILRKEWLYDSMKKKKWLPEEKYEMYDFSPAIQDCRIERQAFGQSYTMDIFRDFGPIFVCKTTRPQRSDLIQLILLCRGKIVSNYEKAAIIVGHLQKLKAICVNETWLLDSIVNNKIQPTEYYKFE